jgi:predicted transcriptional regulator
MAETTAPNILSLTAEIVAAHVASNQLSADALPALIHSVFQSLSTVSEAPEEFPQALPAVPWKKSVFPDFIVCLEDGKKFSMLKRHLRTSYNLTPEQYRKKWGLPWDYPMVAPSYASRRSVLAKQVGLGQKADPHKLAKTPTARRVKAKEG